MQRKEGIVPGTEIARETEIVESGTEAVIEKVVVIETGATTETGVATAAGIEAGGIRVDTTMTRGSFSFSGPLSQVISLFRFPATDMPIWLARADLKRMLAHFIFKTACPQASRPEP